MLNQMLSRRIRQQSINDAAQVCLVFKSSLLKHWVTSTSVTGMRVSQQVVEDAL